MAIRFYNLGENPHSKAVLDRPLEDMLTGSGYLADGTDFAGFAALGAGPSSAFPVYNVKAGPYNAVGNGVADDTTAIQAAVTACNAASGGIIFFPAGTYKITAAINLGTTGNISLIGGYGRATLVPSTAGQRGVTGGGAISNVFVDGLNVVGTGYAMGYTFAPATNITIQNCTISGANANDPTAPGITAGIYCGTATNVTIDNCKFSNNGYTSGLPQTLGADILMGGNAGVGDVQQGITITRCRCLSTAVLQNVGLFDVSGGYFAGNEMGGAIVDAASNTRGGYPLMLYNTISNPGACHHNRVIGNRITGSQGTGIYLQTCHNSKVIGNELTGTATTQVDSLLVVAGVAVAGCINTTVADNTFNGVSCCAISVSDTFGSCYGVSVSGNVIDGVSAGAQIRPSIYIRSAVTRCSIVGNEIVNTGDVAGIGMRDAGLAMAVSSQVRIANNSITGARVVGTGTISAAAGAAIITTSQTGIVANGEKILVGNVAYTCSAFGGGGTTCTLSGAPTIAAGTPFIIPKITGTQGRGILLFGAQDYIVEGNSIENVGQEGIAAQDGSGGGSATANIKVINNTVTDASGAAASTAYGISVTGTACIVALNHSRMGALAQQYGGISATGTGTVAHDNYVNTCTTVITVTTGTGARAWNNYDGTNVSFLEDKTRTHMVAAPFVLARFTTAYSVGPVIDITQGNESVITATNGTAFTLSTTGTPTAGMILRVTIRNTSGGALGVITWNAVFKMAAWTNPANGFSRTITFAYDGTNFVEQRNDVDVPN